MIHSDNDTVKVMTAFFLSTEASFLAENFRYIMYTYKIPMFAWYKELSVLLKCITCPSSPSDIQWCSGGGATGAIAPVPIFQGGAPLQFLFHLFLVNLLIPCRNYHLT